MKRYIEILLGGRRYRFLIDDELDVELRKTLRSLYQFDNNNTLIIDESDLANSYQAKQLILKSILNQISTYDLDSDLQRRIDTLKDYTDKRNTVYSSDLSKLESILAEASEIYGGVRSNLAKKEVAEEQRENVKKNLEDIQEVSDVEEIENGEVSDTTSTTDDKISEFKTILEDLSYDETLRNEVPIKDINDAFDRIVICSSMAEFIEKTGSNVGTYDVINAIKNKKEKIVLPPNTKLEDVVVEVIKTCVNNDRVLDKVVTYVERKASYQNKTNDALESLRSSLKVHGLTGRNLNYFGDQFFNEFERICNETGISFEAMFADYFNGYSQNRRYNSPMDKFIRMFNKFNGGDENTRSLLEAMLVKKAISRHLISSKYNNYLKDEYRRLNVNGNGYINFNESSFNRMNDFSEGVEIDNTSHIGLNNHSYDTELNMANSLPRGGTLDGTSGLTDSEMLQSTLAMNRRNRGLNGSLTTSTSGDLNTTETTSLSTTVGTVGRNLATNGSSNPSLYSEDEDEYSEEDDDTLTDDNTEEDNTSSDGSNSSGSSSSDSGESEEESPSDEAGGAVSDAAEDAKNALKKKAKDSLKKIVIEFIKKNPWVLGVAAVILFVILLILILLASEDNNKRNQMGYYETACNFNDSRVTIVSCSTDSVLQTLELKDYVVRMAYLYTKDGSYSDEAIKALMITLKTNALGLGAYNSGNKNVSVKICDAYSGSVDESSIFDGVEDKLSDLNKLYESVSEYLFVSSSYRSSLSSLGRANVINIDSSTLTSFEQEANNGKNYSDILNSVFNTGTEEFIQVSESRETLFLGDSRTQGILGTGVIDEAHTVYGVAYGYNWFVGSSGFNGTTNASNGAINALNDKMTSGISYNIVLWLGVNDLGNANRYLEKYIELAKGDWSTHNIYVVSVGPVKDSVTIYAKNDKINEFNNIIKDGINKSGLSNLFYIDLGLTESSIEKYDDSGVHYDKNDYRNIYNKIASEVGTGPTSISTTLSLYRLSDYCTYYTLTENDAYWWPVGSKEATGGNIYGGEPTTTHISSFFGWRVVNGVESNHKGIDISGGDSCFSNVIVAAKSGVVTKINDTCDTIGYYRNSCGGYFGNYVQIDHGDGVVTIYAHMTQGSITVKEGDTVSQGQKLGIMGSSGSSTGCHLHFEMRINGTSVNPVNYVDGNNPRPVNTLSPTITGINGDNRNMVCSSLLASGFSKEATIGIMANLSAESAYNPINLQNTYETKLGYTDASYTLAVDNGTYKNFVNDSAGYGLVQWTSAGRKQNFYNYAKERNTSIGNFDTQFNFMLKELENSYSKTYKYITSNHTALEIGSYWCDHYESPGGSEPCSKHGNCPSQHCVNRTTSKIAADNIETYVKNGCKY